MKGKGKAPTKSAAASTAKKSPPKKKPQPRTPGKKYTNWKQEPVKSALDFAIEEKLKGLDPQLSAGGIIIPDATLRDHVRYAKDEAKKRGVS